MDQPRRLGDISENLNAISATRALCINKKSIEDEHIRKISNYFATHREEMDQLSKLELHGCDISSHGFAHLAMLLQMMPTLDDIVFCNFEIEREGAIWLADGFRSKESLKRLRFGNCDLGEPEMKELIGALRSLPSLAALILTSNPRLDVGGINHVATMLSTNTTLIHLNLDNCCIDMEQIMAISNALETNPVLRILELGMNEIDDEEAVLLANTIPSSTFLTILDLQNNCICSPGAAALVAAFVNRGSKVQLFLGDNLIGSATAMGSGDFKPLANAQAENDAIWFLSLNENCIGDDDAVLLSNALKQPECNLHSIELTNSEMTVLGFDILAQSFRNSSELHNTSLMNLVLMDDADDAVQVSDDDRAKAIVAREIGKACRRNLINAAFSAVTKKTPTFPFAWIPHFFHQEEPENTCFPSILFKIFRACPDFTNRVGVRLQNCASKKRKAASALECRGLQKLRK